MAGAANYSSLAVCRILSRAGAISDCNACKARSMVGSRATRRGRRLWEDLSIHEIETLSG